MSQDQHHCTEPVLYKKTYPLGPDKAPAFVPAALPAAPAAVNTSFLLHTLGRALLSLNNNTESNALAERMLEEAKGRGPCACHSCEVLPQLHEQIAQMCEFLGSNCADVPCDSWHLRDLISNLQQAYRNNAEENARLKSVMPHLEGAANLLRQCERSGNQGVAHTFDLIAIHRQMSEWFERDQEILNQRSTGTTDVDGGQTRSGHHEPTAGERRGSDGAVRAAERAGEGNEPSLRPDGGDGAGFAQGDFKLDPVPMTAPRLITITRQADPSDFARSMRAAEARFEMGHNAEHGSYNYTRELWGTLEHLLKAVRALGARSPQ